MALLATILAIVYMFLTYLRTAGLFYNPPWNDPLLYLSGAVGLLAIGMRVARAFPMSGSWRATLIIGGLLVAGECIGAHWFDRSFQAQCDSLPPGSIAPGCPDLPYRP